MAFQMEVESLSGFKIAPPGLYEVILKGFRPRLTKNKDSVTFNAQMEIINHPDYDGTKVFEMIPAKAGFIQCEFSHAFGVEMEDRGNGNYAFPGIWDGDLSKFKADDPSTWVYDGPLIGRTAQVEIAVDTYDGKESNRVKRYMCALPNCDYKHSSDLMRKKG